VYVTGGVERRRRWTGVGDYMRLYARGRKHMVGLGYLELRVRPIYRTEMKEVGA